MRAPLLLSALPLLLAAPLGAQASERGGGRGARPHRSCGSERLERVLVTDGEGRSGAALDSVAADVAFWFRPEAASAVRNTAYAVVLGDGGVVIEQGETSGDAAFDLVTRQAVDAAAHEHAFSRLAPAAGAAPVRVIVHFGEDARGRQTRFVERSYCVAEQRPDSPRPSFPLELLPNETGAPVVSNEGTPGVAKSFRYGAVEATFVVDTAGRVDPATFRIVSSSHEGFTREVKRVLPLLRFYPAELAGRPAPQVVSQRFDFSAH